MIFSLYLQEWFPMHAQFLALSNGWLTVIAGTVAVIYVWIKVMYVCFSATP